MKLTKKQREQAADLLRAGVDAVLVKRPQQWFVDAIKQGHVGPSGFVPSTAKIAAASLGASDDAYEAARLACVAIGYLPCTVDGVEPMDEVATALEAALLIEEGVLP